MIDLLNMFYNMKKLYALLCIDLMKQYALTRSELDILLFLYNHPGFDTAKDIVEKRGIMKSHASLGIEKLVQKGYLMTLRDENDKRKYHLVILDKALPIIKDGLVIQKKFYQILFCGIDEKDIQVMNKIYEQIADNLKEAQS